MKPSELLINSAQKRPGGNRCHDIGCGVWRKEIVTNKKAGK
jgi:hypothetical protein